MCFKGNYVTEKSESFISKYSISFIVVETFLIFWSSRAVAVYLRLSLLLVLNVVNRVLILLFCNSKGTEYSEFEVMRVCIYVPENNTIVNSVGRRTAQYETWFERVQNYPKTPGNKYLSNS
jgi:hypothetical protein